MASVFNFNTMDDWNLKHSPVQPTGGMLPTFTQETPAPNTPAPAAQPQTSSAIPEMKESTEAVVPQQQASVTPFGGKTIDPYKSSFNAAEERKSAWELIKDDPQTTMVAFAMSMLANNDGTKNVSQLVGQAGLDALTAVQTREKTRYERAKAADELAYGRWKDLNTQNLDLRKQDWTERFQGDQSKRGWANLGIEEKKLAIDEMYKRGMLTNAQRNTLISEMQLGLDERYKMGMLKNSEASTAISRRQLEIDEQYKRGQISQKDRENALKELEYLRKAEEDREIDRIASGGGASVPQVDRNGNPTWANGGVHTGTAMDHGNPLGWGGAGSYGVFDTPEKAYNRYWNQLKLYQKAGAKSVRDLITGKAIPNSDKRDTYAWAHKDAGNNTDEYLKRLAEHGIDVDADIDISDPSNAAALLSAMGYAEQGPKYADNWGKDRVFGLLTGAGRTTSVPTVASGGIQQTDTTGAPRVGAQTAIPGFRFYTPAEQRALSKNEAGRALLKYNSPSENVKAQSEARKAEAEARKIDPAWIQQEAQIKNVGPRQEKLYDSVRTIDDMLPRYQVMDEILANKDFKTGKFQEYFDEGGRILKAFGASDELIKNLGANNPAAADAFSNQIYRSVFDELALQKGVQTEGDAMRAQKLWVSIGNTKEGNQIVNKIARKTLERKADIARKEMQLWGEYKGDPVKVDEELRKYKESLPMLFDSDKELKALYEKHIKPKQTTVGPNGQTLYYED